MLKQCVICEAEFEGRKNRKVCSGKCKRAMKTADMRRYRKDDLDKFTRRNREYKAANRAKLRAAAIKYRAENLLSVLERQRAHCARKTAAVRVLQDIAGGRKYKNNEERRRKDREAKALLIATDEIAREKAKTRNKKWYRDNFERVRERAAKRTAALQIVRQLQQGIMP